MITSHRVNFTQKSSRTLFLLNLTAFIFYCHVVGGNNYILWLLRRAILNPAVEVGKTSMRTNVL